MKNSMFTWIADLALVLVGVSCADSPVVITATGAPYEVLVVMDGQQWEAPAGRALFDALDRDVDGLPQSEPSFDISQCEEEGFDGMMRRVRNIVICDISDIYTAPKLKYARDVWSKGQMVLKIQAPDELSFELFVAQYYEKIAPFFTKVELNRSIDYLNKTYNTAANAAVDSLFGGVQLHLMTDVDQMKKGEDFLWVSNNSGTGRRDAVIYSFPYTDPATFTLEYMINKRDSVMKINVPGAFENSYMSTERRFAPTYTAMSLGGRYVAEVRGLWRMEGDLMGGPFVQHAILDEAAQRVIVAEIFVFAPEREKRNLVRLMEASLYTLRLADDQNDENTVDLAIEEEESEQGPNQ